MEFSRVRFTDFKNIMPRDISFAPGLNLLYGRNGAGKTNILEGINLLFGWGPLPGTKRSSLLSWKSRAEGKNEITLTGLLSTGEAAEAKISHRTTLRLDNKAIRASDLRTRVPVMTFLPDDVMLIEGASAYRRRILDMTLALLLPVYALRLSEYRHGIRQKAALLKRGMASAAADRSLLPAAVWIWKMREQAVALFAECLSESREILPGAIELSLKRGGAGNVPDAEEDYIKSLMLHREREAALKFPLVGPHRDDIIITCGNMPASEFFSRGLRRRCAIALMLAAASAVKRKLGSAPILLFDEVTSDLDSEGKEILFSILEARRCQVIAATAEAAFAEENKNVKIHIIEHGEDTTL